MLLWAVLALVCIGLVEIYSVTSSKAVLQGGDPFAQMKRQLMYAIVGFGVLAVVARMGVARLRTIAPAAVGTSIVLLVAVLILPLGGGPVHGVLVNGARRWLAIGPLQLQPSEVAKMAVILWIAAFIVRNPKQLVQPKGLVPFFALTGVIALLILKEPDLGTAGLIVMTTFAMLFVAGAPIQKLGQVAAGIACLVVMVVATSDYQRARVTSFLNPWADPARDGYQAIQALIAIGSGGLFGRGLGNSIQKNFYLPESHTDMIIAIIGEELGLVGLFTVLACFIVIGIAGFRIAMRAKDQHQRLIATGITSLICIQAAVNIGQVFGVLPVTGVPLPFVSAGGTSLVVFLAGIGTLVNISRRGSAPIARRAAKPDSSADRSGRDGGTRQAGPRDRRRLAS